MSYPLDALTKGAGFTVIETANENLGARKLVYRDTTGGWRLVDADIMGSVPVLGITMHAITSGRKGEILLWGLIGDSLWSWTTNLPIYASSVAGELTQTLPAAHDAAVQAVGTPWTTPTDVSEMMLFTPNMKVETTKFFQINSNNFDDIRTPVSSIRLPGANAPAVVGYKGGQVLSFVDNADNIIYFLVQLPHSWVEGSDLDVHIHWTPKVAGSGVGVENVKWDVTHSWANIGAAFPGETTITQTRDVQNDAVDTHLLTEFTDALTGTGKTFSSMIIMSLKRDTGVANNYGDDAYLLEIDFHYKKGKAGTKEKNP